MEYITREGEDIMKRKRNSMSKSYNLQGWTDVRKIVQVIQHMESTGIRINNMSDLLTTIIDIRSMVADRAGIMMPESIADAFEWLRARGFTTIQIDRGDKRNHLISTAMEDEDRIMEMSRTIANNRMRADAYERGEKIENKLGDILEDKIELVGPSMDKFPIEPEEHKGTCHHRGLILDDGINCHKCGFFVPNEIEEKEESNELQHS
jgi:hypothetical protein